MILQKRENGNNRKLVKDDTISWEYNVWKNERKKKLRNYRNYMFLSIFYLRIQ